VGVLLVISYHLTGVVVIFSSIFMIETVLISRILKNLSLISVNSTRNMTVDAEESLNCVKIIKLFNLYQEMKDSFRKNCSVTDFTNRKKSLIIQWQTVLANTILILSVSSLIYINTTFSYISISLLLTFFYTLQKLNKSLTEINKSYGTFNSEIPRLERIIEFFNQHEKYLEKNGNIVTKKLMQENLTLENVSFQYNPSRFEKTVQKKEKSVLKNISLSIYQGQTIALVGESGSGKSSLANLLVRLYEPDKGKILIDGINIRDFDLNFLRNRIGLVNQEPILFNKSIRDNLILGRREATEQEMKEASSNAHLNEFIDQFPDGYDIKIGDSGVKISGGQRQRLNIAQVFLKKPEILILDEATSSLDTKSEEYIKQSIKRISQNCTSIIISHRLSTVRQADKVFVLEKGRIVEEGTWESLMESKGIFFDMVKRQKFLKEVF